jgi:hypothetical protein
VNRASQSSLYMRRPNRLDSDQWCRRFIFFLGAAVARGSTLRTNANGTTHWREEFSRSTSRPSNRGFHLSEIACSPRPPCPIVGSRSMATTRLARYLRTGELISRLVCRGSSGRLRSAGLRRDERQSSVQWMTMGLVEFGPSPIPKAVRFFRLRSR